jgi:hypothetical protein
MFQYLAATALRRKGGVARAVAAVDAVHRRTLVVRQNVARKQQHLRARELAVHAADEVEDVRQARPVLLLQAQIQSLKICAEPPDHAEYFFCQPAYHTFFFPPIK